MDITPIPAPVAAFIDAINNADTEAFVALFEETGFVDDWGTVYSGPEGVRRWAGSDAIGARARMTLLRASTEHDTTTIVRPLRTVDYVPFCLFFALVAVPRSSPPSLSSPRPNDSP